MIRIISSQLPGSNNRTMLADLHYDDRAINLPVVIFVHGFKGFKDWGHFPLVGDAVARAGFAFLRFNLSHNGTTADRPTDFADLEAFGNNNYHKELFDTQCVIDAVCNGTLFPDVPMGRDAVLLLGHSRGGAITVIKTGEESRVRGLVTWNSICHMNPTTADLAAWEREGVVYVPNARTGQQMPLYYQFVEDYYAQQQRYDLQQACASITVPTLYVHGTADTTVPFACAERLQAWTKGASLLAIEGGDHTLGGRHPFEDTELPTATQKAVQATVLHFQKCWSGTGA